MSMYITSLVAFLLIEIFHRITMEILFHIFCKHKAKASVVRLTQNLNELIKDHEELSEKCDQLIADKNELVYIVEYLITSMILPYVI